MEKLDAQQAALVQKMSSARLVAKLSQEGISEDELDKMSREQLMAKWAEILVVGVKGKAKPAATAAAVSSSEIERERLPI